MELDEVRPKAGRGRGAREHVMAGEFDRLEAFNLLIALSFKQLLEAFPAASPVKFAAEAPALFESQAAYRRFLNDTLSWLVCEGLIHDRGWRLDTNDVAAHAAPRIGATVNMFALSGAALRLLKVKIETLDGETVEQALATQDTGRLARVGGTIAYVSGRFTGGFFEGMM